MHVAAVWLAFNRMVLAGLCARSAKALLGRACGGKRGCGTRSGGGGGATKRRCAAVGISAMLVLVFSAGLLGLLGSSFAASKEAGGLGDVGAADEQRRGRAAVAVPFGEHWIELEALEQARSKAQGPHGGVAALRALGIEHAAATEFVLFFGELRASVGEEARWREDALQSCHDETRGAIDVGCVARYGAEIRNRLGTAARRQGGRRRRVNVA